MDAFPITISPDAIPHLKRLLAKAGEGAMLRIGVKGGGCSGFEYVAMAEFSRRDSDLSTEIEGIAVLCDPKSAAFLVGSTLKYTGNLVGHPFAFENPNAERSCGCGTSFTPRKQR